MQVLQAGQHKLILLELETAVLSNIARQAGFEVRTEESDRGVILDLSAPGRQAPLLLFDASDPANLGWFSRCQFYVDGHSGGVMQTPLSVANQRDRSGRPLQHALRLRINKELPANFRLPGKQIVTEQVVYALFYNFLNALMKTGVAVCGVSTVQALAGRTEGIGPRN
ncbi:MAG: hypothetical protein IT158_03355 [Bryobacterales bacterium]|nr:hypothetical protein [Bryobacterales bacterium]